jgi:hypothetical protein
MLQDLFKYTFLLLSFFSASLAFAQVEGEGKDMQNVEQKELQQAATLRTDSMTKTLLEAEELGKSSIMLKDNDSSTRSMQMKMLTDAAKPSFNRAPVLGLWKGAYMDAGGSIITMPGMMDVESGRLTFHQFIGDRFMFEVSGMANKYWMPGQFSLQKQFGVGGSIGYRVNSHISLHAFGNYYGHTPLVGPAMYPYMNTTSFGGFANVQFSSRFRTEVGVHRYFSPLTGRWETDPIIRPYIKVGKSKTEIGGIDFGYLLKSLIIGSREKQMQPPMMVPNPANAPAPAPSGVHRLK